MNFEDRLQKAIHRGQRRGESKRQEERERAMTEEELRRLHSQYRLQLSEYIESCLKRLPNHFPGFRFETIFGERGWGAACSRDDIRLKDGRRENDYSRLEVTIRPYSSFQILELTAKATIRNKELFARSYFEKLEDVDDENFRELIDVWVLEYAEQYASS